MGPLQKKWVEALRSGRYKQGKNYLKEKIGEEYFYCCLGVANEELGLNETSNITLETTWKKLGLRTWRGELSCNCCSLTVMNDEGKTFQEIADFIEQNPEKVFKESL